MAGAPAMKLVILSVRLMNSRLCTGSGF